MASVATRDRTDEGAGDHAAIPVSVLLKCSPRGSGFRMIGQIDVHDDSHRVVRAVRSQHWHV
jgi:hypothetical protein